MQLIKQKASAESWTQDRIGEFASKARREARALNSKASVQDGALKILGDDDEMGDKALGDERNMLGEKIARGKLALENVGAARDEAMANHGCKRPGPKAEALPPKRPKVSAMDPTAPSTAAPGQTSLPDMPRSSLWAAYEELRD